MEATALLTQARDLGRNGLGVPLLVVTMLGMMVIPLPAIALDMLFTFNISLSLIILLVTVYTLRPLDFAVFPTVLLLSTLLRLALNVASTRVVLLSGHTGPDAAGQVIQAFGGFVVGGNYAVGIAVFTILIIINFVVVTKGAGRVSEVNARFTLDAMPGKQMAIDADLNAGLLTQEDARQRRLEITREADFYGSMDGASKFVRGDAVAGILILVVNLAGGLIIGMMQHGLPFSVAAETYTLLTIGDGLVAQIPSLILSTAAAIIVTRVSATRQDMAGQVLSQLFSTPKALAIAAAILGLMGIIPGMPNLAFLTLAAAMGGGAWWIRRQRSRAEAVVEEPARQEPTEEQRELGWDDVQSVDMIGLEVGYRLIPLVDRNQGGQLMGRIKGVRKKLSQELGFLVHPVHIRDNLDLPPNAYRISLQGVPLGEAEVFPDRELAINPGEVFGTLQGIAAKDPAFGLDAVWIEPEQREQAQTMGFTVVDAGTVIATHLSALLQEHAHELLGHEEVQHLLDMLSRQAPKVVEGLVPKALPLGVIVKVLQNLLAESIPIRNMRMIAETLAEHAPASQDSATLTAAVRTALKRSIVQNISGLADDLPVITIDPSLEQLLLQSMQGSADGAPGLEPGLAQRLKDSVGQMVESQEMAGRPAVLVVPPQLRPWLARWLRTTAKSLHVLSYNEIPDTKSIAVIGTIGDGKKQ